MSDLAWGLEMTVLGMGAVFALLAVLMGLLVLIGRLDRPSPPPPVAEPEPYDDAADPPPLETPAPAVRVLADGLTEDELAAIAVAVIAHRDHRRRQAAPEQRTHAPGSHLYASRWVGIGRGLQTQPWRRR